MQLRKRLRRGSRAVMVEESVEHGTLYQDGATARDFVFTKSDRWFDCGEYGDEDAVLVTDPEKIARLEAIRALDEEIVDEWKAKARELSEGDTLLERVLLSSLYYGNGRLWKPCKEEGIEFWSVGQNSSHYFSVGVKDGAAYVLSTCWDEDDDGKWAKRSHIRRVKSGEDWGYVGHF